MKKREIKSCAFISYQTSNKDIAGKLKNILTDYGIDSFLAHEDIDVSEEWQAEIIKYLEKTTIFFCILSKNYLESIYCMQESGVAAFRSMTIIPLTVDGTSPPGFISKYQAKRITFDELSIKDVIPGLLKYDKNEGIRIIIKLIGQSGTYKDAEKNFEYILPVLDKLTDEQADNLLDKILSNGQVKGSYKCSSDYIPRTLQKYGYLLPEIKYQRLKKHYTTLGAGHFFK
jgi:hypothetical protein